MFHEGSTTDKGGNRTQFGEAVNMVLDKLSKEEAAAKVVCIDVSPPLLIRRRDC